MPEQAHLEPADLHGLSRLAVDATLGVTDLVEALHHTIAGAPGVAGTREHVPMRGIPGLVYGGIRGIARLVGGGLDAIPPQSAPPAYAGRSSPERDAGLAALNGVVGDHLTATGNSLAIPMRLRRDGQALVLDAEALAAAIEQPSGKLLLMVHGLCLSDRQWRRRGHDHGALLATEQGYTNIYLHYNTGLHISENGRAFANLLESLLHSWPVPVQELVIVGHSMGGLVTRSACHYGALADHAWPQQLSKIVFLGTPHHGSPVERAGHWLTSMLGASSYTAAFERLGRLRSAGITDLRYGSLVDDDWAGCDGPTRSGPHQMVRLPEGVQCYCIGASTGQAAGDLRDWLLGDGLVPLHSALGYHDSPSLALLFREQWIGYDMNHMDLLDRRDVYQQLRQWLAEE